MLPYDTIVICKHHSYKAIRPRRAVGHIDTRRTIQEIELISKLRFVVRRKLYAPNFEYYLRVHIKRLREQMGCA